MPKWIFDVDGTLTPSRQRISKDFENWLEHWGTHNAYYIVTGSDRKKTLEQIGGVVYNQAIRVYQCAGNDVWEGDYHVRASTTALPQSLLVELDKELHKSKFTIRTGEHFDYRAGLVNFSIVGRGAVPQERHAYKMWDDAHNERERISRKLSSKFPDYSFQVAGETGIDITLKGEDKSQILKDFDSSDELFFFGDKCQQGGNDYELAQAIKDRAWGRVIEVNDWKDTWRNLKLLV